MVSVLHATKKHLTLSSKLVLYYDFKFKCQQGSFQTSIFREYLK